MPIVRLPNGDLRDEIRQPLFDTISAVAGQNPNIFNNQSFFSNAAGKAPWQTNLRQNNLLETAVSYRVMGMALDAQYLNNNATLLAQMFLPNLMDYGAVRVHIGEKDYWTGPMNYVMGRLEQNGAVAYSPEIQAVPADTAGFLSGLVYQRCGAPAVQGVVLSGRHVVDINPLQSFYVQMTVEVPTALAALATCSLDANDQINLKFSFKGLQRRPVQ